MRRCFRGIGDSRNKAKLPVVSRPTYKPAMLRKPALVAMAQRLAAGHDATNGEPAVKAMTISRGRKPLRRFLSIDAASDHPAEDRSRKKIRRKFYGRSKRNAPYANQEETMSNQRRLRDPAPAKNQQGNGYARTHDRLR